MKWENFVKKVAKLPVIDTELLLAGVKDPKPFKVQVSRWQKTGKLLQLKRGFYVLSETYRQAPLFEPYVSFLLKRPSYLSLEKALEYHGLIPEGVPVYTAVTSKRAARFSSEVGVFTYRHIKQSLFWGYESVMVNSQTGFIALPEKALLDVVYFHGMNITLKYLEGLRLQDVDKINPEILLKLAGRFKSLGMMRAAAVIKKYIEQHKKSEKQL
jgi:predicted transcriptional regulator of viral defense system